ncbi:MAG TPA: hypothetical protein VMT70_11105 [Vicinamibacteria bacterium]|nr:hypothetical protein [Vicinamibacteria bacterium]
MSCERNRSGIRRVALGTAPSRRLEAHLVSCSACRGILDDDRRWLAEMDEELRKALAVEPSASLLPRVREVASRRLAEEPRSRLLWLLPVAASIVALAMLLPFARRIPLAPGSTPAPPSPTGATIEPAPSQLQIPATIARPQARKGSPGQQARGRSMRHRAPARTALVAVEPEVIVPPGGEAALLRYVRAIRHTLVVDEVVLGPGPDPINWTEPASMRQQPRAVERFPEEMEPPTTDAEAHTLGD